jgi:site-specific DNA recombinase
MADKNGNPSMQDDSTATAPVPVIGYIRVSMMHEEAISPDLQRTAIEDWARRRGRKVIDWAEDLDKTGRDFQRKIMKQIERIEAREAREIAVWKYSRFGRNRHGCAVNLARIEAAGGRLQSATEEVDAKTAVGKLTRGMLMEIAAFESDRAGEQWGEARAHRLAAGLHDVGRAKFGYTRLGRIPDPERPGRTRRDLEDRQGERYVPDPVTGPVLNGIYLAYTAGQTFNGIARQLNLAGTFNTYGRRWSWDTVRDVLDSGFGAGRLRVHDPACDECASPSRCRSKIYLPGAHEPVITEPQWQAYVTRREQVAATPPRARAAVYRLTGLVRCGHCGSKMSVLKPDRRNKAPRLRCSRWTRFHDCRGGGRKIPYPVALDAVMYWLRAERISLGGDGRAELGVAASRTQAAIGQLSASLAKVDRKLARFASEQLLDDDVPDEVWEQTKTALLAQRAPIAAELAAARQRAEVEPADVLPAVSSLLEGWDVLPVPRIREMLAALIHCVVVWRADEDGQKIHRARVFPAWEPVWAGPGSDGIPG